MKNIKEVIIGVFAVIGFAAIVTGFTNEAVQEHTVPESHVWEMHPTLEENFGFMYNKVTGEVRKLNSYTPKAFSTTKNKTNIGYIVMNEVSAEE